MKTSSLSSRQFFQIILLCYAITTIRFSSCESCSVINSVHPNTSVSIGNNNNDESPTLESSISDFLSTFSSNDFHIQGWKWHTLSLIRDSKRLERLAHRLLSDNSEVVADDDNTLEKATNYVIDFNMKALHKIENELFFPFLKQKLTASAEVPKEIQEAFHKIISDLEDDRVYISKLATTLREQAKVASLPNLDHQKRLDAINNVAKISGALTFRTRGIFSKEERYLIPAISALVPANEQKSFSNKVLRKLGILDSRLHLVGMHDAVWEKEDDQERELFISAIPFIPRMMIPRWRKSLYEPQAGVLDEL